MELTVKLPVTFIREGDAYVAYCPILDLSTSAESFEEAKKRFEEVVPLFFEELIDMGTLDEVLTGLGWTKMESKWNPPMQIAHDLTSVTVPLSA